MAIGENIRKIREAKGMTAARVAKTLDVSAAFISRIEKGTLTPPLWTVPALAKLFGCTTDELFGLK